MGHVGDLTTEIISEPVGTPDISSKYFLRNVFPDLGNVRYVTLSMEISSSSRNL